MTPFTGSDLAEWLDEQFAALLTDQRQSYELQADEFTAAMYAEAAGVPMSTAHARLLKLREAERIPARRELIDGRRVWVYTRKETE